MNKLVGTISQIHQAGSVMLVDINVNNYLFSAMLIASGEEYSWLRIGNHVGVIFKETEVSLAKGLSGQISLRNRMTCKVTAVTKGELLSKITLNFIGMSINSVITTRSVMAMNIAPGDEMDALVKANEISLMQNL
jgi:molybdate transport system regulatory protein